MMFHTDKGEDFLFPDDLSEKLHPLEQSAPVTPEYRKAAVYHINQLIRALRAYKSLIRNGWR